MENRSSEPVSNRVDEFGRAFAGSQLQIQTYVNRRRDQLDAAILEALPELAERGALLEWVSPLEEGRFVEYFDESFLSALGLLEVAGMLADFWPQRGPQWDALAKIHWSDNSPSGVLLVEAKSYPMEMFSGGCLATEPSRSRIARSLESARTWLGGDAADWTGSLYQFANRLAHLYFLRVIAGVPAWFANVCFAGDPYRPTPVPVWKEALESAKATLGLSGHPVPFSADVILEGVGRELFQVPPRTRVLTASIGGHGPGKEWRFLRNDRMGKHQFLGFVNARGSSSLRFFDADTGVQIGEPRYGRKRSYQEAFAWEISASVSVFGPRVVSNVQISLDKLLRMRSQVGLKPIEQQISPITSRPSILAGVDDIVDRALCVSDIGRTAPHYRHLTAYRVVAGNRTVDGPALIKSMYSRIAANWLGTPCRGGENWRWEKKTYISDLNESPEKRFEKALAAECGEWYNMIPVASGVLPDVEEGGRRIDLARSCGPGWFELVELKLGNSCDTPLHAAIEILGYGLIYVFSRRHARDLGYDSTNILLSAHCISLKVLAPSKSYSQGSLANFESEVNRGLAALVDSQNPDCLTMDFRFEQLPADFESGSKSESPCAAINRRSAVYE